MANFFCINCCYNHPNKINKTNKINNHNKINKSNKANKIINIIIYKNCTRI